MKLSFADQMHPCDREASQSMVLGTKMTRTTHSRMSSVTSSMWLNERSSQAISSGASTRSRASYTLKEKYCETSLHPGGGYPYMQVCLMLDKYEKVGTIVKSRNNFEK